MEKRYDECPGLEELGLTPEDSDVHDVDPARWLDSPEAIASYLDEAVAGGDARYVAHCLGQVAKVVGMGKIAGMTGLNRQALYRSLSGDMSPRVDTLLAVLRALGMRLHISPADEAA